MKKIIILQFISQSNHFLISLLHLVMLLSINILTLSIQTPKRCVLMMLDTAIRSTECPFLLDTSLYEHTFPILPIS